MAGMVRRYRLVVGDNEEQLFPSLSQTQVTTILREQIAALEKGNAVTLAIRFEGEEPRDGIRRSER